MNGLLIKQPWIDAILDGKKTWEIRGSNTHIRGDIYLIQSGSGLILGKATLVNALFLSEDVYFASVDKHTVPHGGVMPYKKTYAWVLENAIRFEEPIPYKHPQGAVIWVKLEG